MEPDNNRSRRTSVLDAERWARLNSGKLAALVEVVGSNPALAGRAVATMGLSEIEARALVTQAIVEADPFPRVGQAMRSLMPAVEAWRSRPDVAAAFGTEAEALGLLWAWVVALGWICGRG